MREPQGQIRHIHNLIRTAVSDFKYIYAILTKNLSCEFSGELVMTGRHWRMRCKDTLMTDAIDIFF